MKSMTAFAREDVSFRDYQLSVEIKSVNHRYLDIHIRLPERLRFLEVALRESAAKKLSRGRVDVFIKMESLDESRANMVVNAGAVKALHQAAESIQQIMPSAQSLTVSDVLHYKGVLEASEFDEKQLQKDTSKIFESTIVKLIDSRRQEGEKIQSFLTTKLQELMNEKSAVEALLPEQSNLLKTRITDKLDDVKLEVEHERFEQEVLFYLNRMDVNEELERLEAHLQQCHSLLASSEPTGRKLDFMMQELQREANTLGTKSTMVAIKNHAMEMKVVIEQIREQVQNIE